MLHIDSLLDKRPSILSGGQQQRVALARALAVQPKLLLLDEPLNACDLNTRLQLRRELKRITGQLGFPALHVTHDPEEAISLGDRIAVMLDGRIRQIAPPAELFRSPSRADVASFLGMSNILPVAAVSAEGCSVCGHTVLARGADDSTSYIWIKPEEILLSTRPFESSARNQFNCRVAEINRLSDLVEVKVASGSLELTSLITYRSLDTLHLAPGTEVYVTFKSSAVHCF
jgi:molybdopterin-binding protein